MPHFHRLTLAILLLSLPVLANEPPSPSAQSTTLTFYIAGVECVACVDVICRSLSDWDGVTSVAMTQNFDSYANITFDPKKVSPHQIAQAITEAPGLHGKPYEPTLRLRIPDYSKANNAANVGAVFARFRDRVTVDTIDSAKGEFIVHFLPLTEREDIEGPQGWSWDVFTHALRDPSPKGLGLSVEAEREGL